MPNFQRESLSTPKVATISTKPLNSIASETHYVHFKRQFKIANRIQRRNAKNSTTHAN
jgi:hypothetical protein